MSPAKDRHPFHSMCSYLGTFPCSVPRRIIDHKFPQDGILLDPFCGAGTTVLEALLSGRNAIGIDLNPLAVALTRAKIQTVAQEDVVFRLNELARQFAPDPSFDPRLEDISIIYHERTLQQLAFLRRMLKRDVSEDIVIAGATLGIMHGKFRKDGSTSYLSIDMPNTFSMSPQYVKNFVRKHGLRKKPVDVFGQLRRRIRWLFREGPPPSVDIAGVYEGDATQLGNVIPDSFHGEIDGIVTSPPYLGVLRYGAFNWIRLWFLEEDPTSVDQRLDATDSLDKYLSFMGSFLISASEILSSDAPVILVIGDVEEGGVRINLAARVWEELGDVVPFGLEDIVDDNFDVGVKTTRIWGEEKRGRATPLDRLLMLRRN